MSNALAQERPMPPKPAAITVEGTLRDAPLVADYRSYRAAAPEPVRIRYRWFQGWALIEVFVALGVDALLVLALSGVGTSKSGSVGLLTHVAICVLLTKNALASLFNTTRFDLGAEHLVAATGPFRWPWQRTVKVPIAELRQLSVLEKLGTRESRSYGVVAHMHDGKTQLLVEGLPDEDVARFFERAIERQLGLPDEPWVNATV